MLFVFSKAKKISPTTKETAKCPDWVMEGSLCHDHSIPDELLSSLGQLLSFKAS